MSPPTRLTGTIASRGLAAGPIATLDMVTRDYRPAGDAAAEKAALTAAITGASAQLAALVATAESTAADMLEFQLAMLEDTSLAEPAYAAIERGADAFAAWRAALEPQIASYDTADDEYFRARGADLRDIRDRVGRALLGVSDAARPAGAILAGDDITPSQFLAADWHQGGAIVLRQGSSASHVAMLARARGVPMLVGVSGLVLNGGHEALVDALEAGSIVLDPDLAQHSDFARRRNDAAAKAEHANDLAARPAVTADGTAIAVHVNIAEPADVDSIDIARCDGVGLMRTEFLYSSGLPDETTQLAAYARVLGWAGDKPVVIRTVDAGGDKPVPGFTIAETNPFLGLRGIRLALRRPEVFRVQIRALLRAATHGNLKVMLPMVTVPNEFHAARTLFQEEAAQLAAAGVPHRMPALGIMIEVPAAALAPELFAGVAFFSIGSNDLTQYAMAAARDSSDVGNLNDPTHPAVLRLIENTVEAAHRMGIPVSLCGDAGSDPAAIAALLGTGLRSLSVAPAQLAPAKAAIAAARLEG